MSGQSFSRGSAAVTMVLALALGAAAMSGCGKKNPAAPINNLPPRHYLVGFSYFPPSLDVTLALTSIQMWVQRADAAIHHVEPPWDSLLAGTRPDSLVLRGEIPLMQYYRSRGLKIVYEADPTNGLNRAADSAPLVAAGRSITEPAVQALYRAWVAAVDSLVNPDYLGLASETNLIRASAPGSLYNAVKLLAGSTADTLALLHARLKRGTNPQLYTTVQAEVAWGRLAGSGAYQGVGTDRADFPFAQAYGISSYPYLGGFAQPEDLPSDYYSRIAGDVGKPVMVVEGGWSSVTVTGGAVSSPAMQARYLRKQTQLLDAASGIGLFQLTFADLALSLIPPPPPGTADVTIFAHLGLVDTLLVPKIALATWDSTYRRPLR